MSNHNGSKNMGFYVVVNDHFFNLAAINDGIGLENKEVLSFTNDYENGQWRYKKFHNFIWNNIAEAALSYEDRELFKDSPHSLLVEAAKNLRLVNESNQASELAEILLYAIMKHHYNALPVVPKIFYKQNSSDYVKGADSVHITVENDDFSLWFGEGKFYKSIDDTRLNTVIKSVENMLDTDKLKKENSIITGINELDKLIVSEELKKKIRVVLSSSTSIDRLKLKLNIPILLLHECAITKKGSFYSEEFIKEIKEYHCDRATAYFSKQISSLAKKVYMYSAIKFHLILFGVPSKEAVVNNYMKSAENFRGM